MPGPLTMLEVGQTWVLPAHHWGAATGTRRLIMARMRLLGGLGSSGEPSKNGGAHAALPTRARVFGRFPPKDTSLASDTERAEILKDPPAASASLVTTTEDGAHSRDL